MNISYIFFKNRYILKIDDDFLTREELIRLISYDDYDNLIDLCLIYPKNVVNDNLYMCSRKKENIEKTISTINSILVFKELVK